MTRAASAPEKVLLRSSGQSSSLYFDVLRPVVIFKAQINQTFDSDSVYEFAFDNVTEGAYTDVQPGMLAWIGTTSGDNDLGELRVRKDFTSTTAYVAKILK